METSSSDWTISSYLNRREELDQPPVAVASDYCHNLAPPLTAARFSLKDADWSGLTDAQWD